MTDKILGKDQFIFASIFVISNRLQTACEKIQKEITMKQWLLLAILEHMDEEKNLTNLGKVMGCSRQNVKKLANPLVEMGYINFIKGTNNSLILEPTSKVSEYSKEMANRHLETLNLLFEDFSSEEIDDLYKLYVKIFNGLEKVEVFGDKINEDL